MTFPFIPYAKQNINALDIEAVQKSLQEEWITRGPLVQEFEKKISTYCEAKYAVAFNSGTSALMACYFATQLTIYDRIFSTPNSFIATIGAPIAKGVIPQFIDIDCSTGNLDIHQISSLLFSKPSRGQTFIVPVHFAGIALDMAYLDQQIRDPDTIVIEDAAHALGSYYPTGGKVGSCKYSQLTIFSFHPTKTMTTGEGGIVTTNDPLLYQKLQLFRDNGIEREIFTTHKSIPLGYYEVQAITGNYHLTSFQAALGISQLERIELFIVKRRNLIKHYRKRLKNIPSLTLFTDKQDNITAFHLCVVQIDFEAYQITRQQVMQELRNQQIGTQIHYIPLYRHPVLSKYSFPNFPQSEKYYSQALTLPLYYELEVTDVDRICSTLLSILGHSKYAARKPKK